MSTEEAAMPDRSADPSAVPGSSPGAPEADSSPRSASDPQVRCPNCGADVVPREASYGWAEETRGLACPNCGEVISTEREGELPPGAAESRDRWEDERRLERAERLPGSTGEPTERGDTG
jgi:hypothetical protein